MEKLRESKAFDQDNRKWSYYLFTEMGVIRTRTDEKVGQNQEFGFGEGRAQRKKKEFGFLCYASDTYQTYSKFAKGAPRHLCKE